MIIFEFYQKGWIEKQALLIQLLKYLQVSSPNHPVKIEITKDKICIVKI